VLAQENANGEVLWALTDHQGSVRMLLDNQGNVVNEITYDAFGNITLETHSQVNFRFGYTGREFDSETGLYNYRTRFYDPGVGEFVSEDTIGFAGGDANLSRYVANSPLNYIDPSGFCRVGSSGRDQDRLSDLWDTLKPVRQFFDGLATQLLLNETGGEVYIGLFDSKFNEGFAQASNQSLSLKLGRTAADVLSILQGSAEIAGGKFLEGSGLVLSIPSGGTSLIAVPAGAVLDVHGGVVAGSGIKDITEIWRENGNNSDDLSPQFYESRSQTPTDRYKEQLFERPGKSKDQSTLRGAQTELQGGKTDAAIQQGKDFDHVTKVRNAQQGLLKRTEILQKKLGDHTLTDAQRASTQKELSEASKLLDHSEGFVPR
jgi:RHS repeat-associated protein